MKEFWWGWITAAFAWILIYYNDSSRIILAAILGLIGAIALIITLLKEEFK